MTLRCSVYVLRDTVSLFSTMYIFVWLNEIILLNEFIVCLNWYQDVGLTHSQKLHLFAWKIFV